MWPSSALAAVPSWRAAGTRKHGAAEHRQHDAGGAARRSGGDPRLRQPARRGEPARSPQAPPGQHESLRGGLGGAVAAGRAGRWRQPPAVARRGDPGEQRQGGGAAARGHRAVGIGRVPAGPERGLPRCPAAAGRHCHRPEALVVASNELAAVRAAQARAQARQVEAQLAAVLLAALVLGIAATLLITRGIVRPLRVAVEVAERVADGDLTGRSLPEQRDETGRVLAALGGMQGRLNALVLSIRRSAGGVSRSPSRFPAPTPSSPRARRNRPRHWRKRRPASRN
ncbi:methyl-accepting chemotaxis protein [Ramlibacter terrae]|uniref:Methyl-accepting chemotaxis protein n=1 Tax=Ramlibacter terrae TaxID=2732511 RepID=A0ABX6P6R2_9BURK|nr:methyl-accepting chemotaxis protein [Ramlibacter terrae]